MLTGKVYALTPFTSCLNKCLNISGLSWNSQYDHRHYQQRPHYALCNYQVSFDIKPSECIIIKNTSSKSETQFSNELPAWTPCPPPRKTSARLLEATAQREYAPSDKGKSRGCGPATREGQKGRPVGWPLYKDAHTQPPWCAPETNMTLYVGCNWAMTKKVDW